MTTFLDDYWWAVFLFLIFMFTVALRPAKPRQKPRAFHPRRGEAMTDHGGESGGA